MSSWLELLQSQKTPIVKKFLWELLQERFGKYDELIGRLSTALTTDKDMTMFSEMAIDLYEKGYLRSVNDHKEELSKLGIKVEIVAKKNQADNPIGLHE